MNRDQISAIRHCVSCAKAPFVLEVRRPGQQWETDFLISFATVLDAISWSQIISVTSDQPYDFRVVEARTGIVKHMDLRQ